MMSEEYTIKFIQVISRTKRMNIKNDSVLGQDTSLLKIKLQSNKMIKLIIESNDLSTLDFIYKPRRRILYRTLVIFCLFDLTDEESFSKIKQYILDLRLSKPLKHLPCKYSYLIGINSTKKEVDQSTFKKFASDNNLRYAVLPNKKLEENKDFYTGILEEIFSKKED